MSWDIHYVHILTHVSFHNSVSMRNDPTAFGNIHFAKQLISLEFSSLFSQNCSQCVTEAFTKCLCFHCTFITPSQRFFASQMFTLLQKRREKKEVKKVPKWNVGNEKVLEVETISLAICKWCRWREKGRRRKNCETKQGKSICKFIHLIKT